MLKRLRRRRTPALDKGVAPSTPESKETPRLESIQTASDPPEVPLALPVRTLDTSDTQALSPALFSQKNDPLGLVVLHSPPQRALDILFIHGLGGTSLRTWCHDRNQDYLWPKLWLPTELPTARILAFGYNADVSSTKEKTASTLGDFASDLLFRMKYGEDTTERLGQVPIIVVAHSMGGLVFKKAFVQGHLNNEFSSITSMIKAVVFLATPHRGTDLAKTLNKLLSGSIFGHSPKKYIAELARKSPTLDDLNEAFRHHATKLQLFSFYETLATAMGPTSTHIVDKTTAVMGYANETSAPLNANHHTVCKFSSSKDPNYGLVVGALRKISASILSPENDAVTKEDLQHLADLLGVAGAPEEDLGFGRSTRTEGTCEAFMRSEALDNWRQCTTQQLLWVHAPPGGGKSTACSYLVDSLIQARQTCAYFFFKYGQQNKQSASGMLRSLAHQTALQWPAFRRALVELARSGVQLSKADTQTIWQKLFSFNVSSTEDEKRFCWIIDGLDEADSSKQVVEILSRISELKIPVRVVAFSRPLANISRAFQLAKKKTSVEDMPLPDTHDDIRLMVKQELRYLMASDGFRAEVTTEIVTRSQGSFLWASLVAQNVVDCHREEQVRQVLDSAPDGMHPLYDRMADGVRQLKLDVDRSLARLVLTWAMYAKTPVTIEELLEVYPGQLGSLMDISHSISQVCGQFVVVDPQGRVTLVHHSAREYLSQATHLPFPLTPELGSEEILCQCLAALCDRDLKRKLHSLKLSSFLPYASVSWISHLNDSVPKSTGVAEALVKFFDGPYPLAWIQYMAMSGRLPELLSASQSLLWYVRERTKREGSGRLSDIALLEAWTADLARVPVKFGRYLSHSPALIYECIPALCPTSSIIHRKFNENPAATLMVSGLSDTEWDDCLARVGGTGRAYRLAVSARHLAVASDESRGTITVWDADLFEEQKVLRIGMHIWALAFSRCGSLLACYSDSRTLVWHTDDWVLQLSVENPRSRQRAIEFKFFDTNCLLMTSEIRNTYRMPTAPNLRETAKWEHCDTTLLRGQDNEGPEAGLGTPSSIAFSNDCSRIAVAYRAYPLSIWTVNPPERIAQLTRVGPSFTGTNSVAWLPFGDSVIALFGKILKWNFEHDTYQEAQKQDGVPIPHALACSPNGKVFATFNSSGLVDIFSVETMSLVHSFSPHDSGMVTNICFSSHSLRLYVIQGSYCNVWEPACLPELAEAPCEPGVEGSTDSSVDFWCDAPGTVARLDKAPFPYTEIECKPGLLAISPGLFGNGILVAYADRAASIWVHDTLRSRCHMVADLKPMGLQLGNTAWFPAQGLIAYSNYWGGATVMSVKFEDNDEVSVSIETRYSDRNRHRLRGRNLGLLFNSTGGSLFIADGDVCQVVSIPEGQVLAERELPEFTDELTAEHAYCCCPHPSDPGHLLYFREREIKVLSWSNLGSSVTMVLEIRTEALPAKDVRPPVVRTISAVLVSHHPGFLLLQVSAPPAKELGHTVAHELAILRTKDLPATPSSNPSPGAPSIRVHPISIDGASTIAHGLGILPDSRLVFVDRQMWVCTMLLSPEGAVVPGMKRHFFLPLDWLTIHDVRLCRLLADGTILCPMKGQVAILRGGLAQG